MSNYYNILADRILEKYKVEEPTKRPLNEAWAASTPDWLKKVFKHSYRTGDIYGSNNKIMRGKKYKKLYQKYINDGFSNEAAERHAMHDYREGQPMYSNIDYKNSNDPEVGHSVSNIVTRLQQLGVDLQSDDLKFIESEPPTSKNDKRLKPPYLSFFYFKSPRGGYLDQIYVPGVNENEKFSINAEPFFSLKMTGKAFHNISYKKISENCDGYAYLDTTNLKRREYGREKASRNSNATDTIELIKQGKERFPSNINRDSAVWRSNPGSITPKYGDYGYDKSGYIQIPSSQKYAEVLEKAKLKKYAEMLTDLENTLRRVADKFRDIMANASFEQIGDYNLASVSSSFLSTFNDVYRHYNLLLSYVERAGIPDTDEFYDKLKQAGFYRDIENTKKQALIAEDKIKELAYTELDF